jgi:hypothetical protein
LNRISELENRPTQTQLEAAVEQEAKKYEDYIAPNNLEKEAEKIGMVSKEKYDKVVRERDNRPNLSKED